MSLDEDVFDENVLRFAASLCSGDPVPFSHEKRGPHDVLKTLVMTHELKLGFNSDEDAIYREMREINPEFKRSQLEDYLRGRFTPPREFVVALSKKKGLPDLRVVADWPWDLLSEADMTLPAIEKVANPGYETTFRLPNALSHSRNERGRSRWYEAKRFRPQGNWLEKPGEPVVFWLHLIRFRAAKVLGDVHSTNMHYWNLVKALPSLVTHRAVAPFAERLYSSVRMLLLRTDPYHSWFTTHWDSIRRSISDADYGATSVARPFRNVFMGTDPHAGRPFPITDLHRAISP